LPRWSCDDCNEVAGAWLDGQGDREGSNSIRPIQPAKSAQPAAPSSAVDRRLLPLPRHTTPFCLCRREFARPRPAGVLVAARRGVALCGSTFSIPLSWPSQFLRSPLHSHDPWHCDQERRRAATGSLDCGRKQVHLGVQQAALLCRAPAYWRWRRSHRKIVMTT